MSTLLVIGNGFDRSLNMKTSYNDFFESDFYKPVKVYLEKKYGFFRGGLSSVQCELDVTCWDLLFFLLSTKDQRLDINRAINWCDVESVIFESFISTNTESSIWQNVYSFLHEFYENKKTPVCDNEIVLSIIDFLINEQWEQYSHNTADFYKELLSQLKAFEKKFGKYILSITNSKEYCDDAIKLATGLVNSHICYIDSFNYSEFIIDKKNTDSSSDKVKIRHINGDVLHPIFGINLKKENRPASLEQEIHLFTKTSRRVYQDSYLKSNSFFSWDEDFDHVVVYGHSLNEMDYDYFYYIFTLLKFNTFDSHRMGTIEFLFSIYDEKQADKIRDITTESIYSLLTEYETSINSNTDQVLINLLRFSGKLIIREIDVLEIMTMEILDPGIEWRVLR